MVSEISKERWDRASGREKWVWDGVLNGAYDVVKKGMGHHRHSAVMFLNPNSVDGKTVVDIGGGAVSMLVDYDIKAGMVVDPIQFPDEYLQRYASRNIEFSLSTGEDFLSGYAGQRYDEVWIYNCLQHVINPEYILRNVAKLALVLRISEPCGYLADEAHPHVITQEWLREILSDISTEFQFKTIQYDYVYAGGICALKSC